MPSQSPVTVGEAGAAPGRGGGTGPAGGSGPEVVFDDHGGATVWSAGQPQSYVQLDDPGFLTFEYVQHLGLLIDVLAARSDSPLRVTHVGGGGLTLARYVEAVSPGARQIVLEPDVTLTELVRRLLPLPRGHRIRVRAVDGRRGVAALGDSSADLVVVDAFAGGSIPAELTTLEFVTDVERALSRAGVLALNVPDEPGRGYLSRVLATIGSPARAGGGTAYRQVVVIATHDVLKGRRFGNYVVIAGPADLPVDRLARQVARSPFPTGLWESARIARLIASARPLTDADPAASPDPPDPGRWRAR